MTMVDQFASSFHHFDASHITVLVLTVAVPLVLAGLSRRMGSATFTRGVCIAVAAVLVVNFVGYAIYVHWVAPIAGVTWLPMQLCDWALVATVAALLRPGLRWFELAYFWGFAGTLQAIITPNLEVGFPNLRFLSFFVMHSGIVVAVLFMIFALGLRPHLSSLWRVWLWSQLYLATALTVNAMTGANYGFLSHKPTRASLLDFLSDQPVLYVFQLELLAILFYAILYLPFALKDWRARSVV